ncbi:MAG: winged helix-turn-helix transcriptional regulator [Deltaproteobacteria bacterium]|nr:winged helix-turn-helix transcriptional regulator [Deltaproteobacteria bacterium]
MPARAIPPKRDAARALYEHHAEMCKVLSNATRLMILNVLRESEMTVAAIAEQLGLALGTVSPHLLMMKQRRVLASRKQGNQVFYRLANPKMLQAFDLIREILYEQMKQHERLAQELEFQRRPKRR